MPAGRQRHGVKAGVWVSVYSRLGIPFVYYRITALGGNGLKAEIETLCVLLFYLLRPPSFFLSLENGVRGVDKGYRLWQARKGLVA